MFLREKKSEKYFLNVRKHVSAESWKRVTLQHFFRVTVFLQNPEVWRGKPENRRAWSLQLFVFSSNFFNTGKHAYTFIKSFFTQSKCYVRLYGVLMMILNQAGWMNLARSTCTAVCEHWWWCPKTLRAFLHRQHVMSSLALSNPLKLSLEFNR